MPRENSVIILKAVLKLMVWHGFVMQSCKSNFTSMKKLSILLSAIVLVASTSFSQLKKTKHTEAEYMSLGPTLGIGHSWLGNLDDQTIKPSGHLGISFIYSRFEHWGWGADLVASHEGFRMEAPNGVNMSIDPTYLRFTPKAYYFFGDYGDKCRPKVYAGPSVAYKLKEDHYYDGERVESDAPQNYWYNGQKNVFNDVDFGLTAGAGLNMRLAKSLWLNLDGSYYHGLADVTDFDQSNRHLRFNVGLMFGL